MSHFLSNPKGVTGADRTLNDDPYRNSKLMAVKYIGAILTLVGCAHVILPSIWVRFPPQFFNTSILVRPYKKGGVTFPWKFAASALRLPRYCYLLYLGMERGMYIFKHVTVSGVYITMFINGYVFFSSLYYLPEFLQIGLGYSPIRAGIFMIPLLVSQMVASWVAGIATIIRAGFAVWPIASGCQTTVTTRSSKAVRVIFMLSAGVGAGLTLQTTTVAAQASVSRRDMSIVTAFRNFIRLLGATLALAISSTLVYVPSLPSLFQTSALTSIGSHSRNPKSQT
ncbi:hypothetical protein H0H93_007303 [Arthromyces matolae]|nr:hypothetical protein H0H93_007303 [Arthromyces matolae]